MPRAKSAPGSLYASGLIAAGGVFGLLAIILNLMQDSELSGHFPRWLHWLVVVLHLPWPEKLFTGFGEKYMPTLRVAPWLGVLLFVLLAATLFVSARKKLKQS